MIKLKAIVLFLKVKVLRDLFRTNQRNGSEMAFVAGATEINLENLKTWL